MDEHQFQTKLLMTLRDLKNEVAAIREVLQDRRDTPEDTAIPKSARAFLDGDGFRAAPRSNNLYSGDPSTESMPEVRRPE